MTSYGTQQFEYTSWITQDCVCEIARTVCQQVCMPTVITRFTHNLGFVSLRLQTLVFHVKASFWCLKGCLKKNLMQLVANMAGGIKQVTDVWWRQKSPGAPDTSILAAVEKTFLSYFLYMIAWYSTKTLRSNSPAFRLNRFKGFQSALV